MRASPTLAGILATLALAGCALQAPPKPEEIQAQSMQNVKLPPSCTEGATTKNPDTANSVDSCGNRRSLSCSGL